MASRRDLLQLALYGIATSELSAYASALNPPDRRPWFPISLAQWSLHRAFRGRSLDVMDFARIARRTFGISAVEYVNTFYQPKFTDALVRELRTRAEGEGVRSVLIRCDNEGRLGDPDSKTRATAVANHHKWVNAARELGCHSIRVNAWSEGPFDEQVKLAADGLRALTEYAATLELNLIVENHGGLSSNGQWLTGVMTQVDHPRCGTLPDFGNFADSVRPSGKRADPYAPATAYDRYTGVEEMMPFARGVSAKSYDFDAAGGETRIDYVRMLKLVRKAGYRGHVGIEYEGKRLSEPAGIRATRALLEKLGGGDSHEFPFCVARSDEIFNGRTLDGWTGVTDAVEIVDGSMVWREGQRGTLYWNRLLEDFELRFDFQLTSGANNGLAIRYPASGDPAYTGMCELQVLEDTAAKYGNLDPRQFHGSAYGMVAAQRGHLRPVGQWNTQLVTVRGSTLRVELNGTVILDTDLSGLDPKSFLNGKPHPGRTRKEGFLGFAGHGDRVAFRNLSVRRL